LPTTHVLESAVSPAGLCTTGPISTLAGQIGSALTAMKTSGCTPMLLHGPRIDPVTGLPDPDAPPPPAPDEIVSISISTLLATQRRRMR
jgi:hypothetical protein